MAGEFRDNTSATGEFFSVGTPLHAVRAGYIRRRADDQLFETVRAGNYAHVLAPERSGKSSLIAAAAARLEAVGRKIAILDLEQIGDRDGGADSGRWYFSVAYRLLRQLRIRYDLQSWWHDKSFLSNRQRLFEFYSEIVLQHVEGNIVVFVDEIQCIEKLPFAGQLLASIRTAHNARTTDPDFSRLTFVLLGECDPVSLMREAELSPFNVTQQVLLNDFVRSDLDLFETELGRSQSDAKAALDRIFYWTGGQAYLSQKLARAVARGPVGEDIDDLVDRLAVTQLAGRAVLHSEPHMSHIHRAIVNDEKRREALLNLYGKIRKGIKVPADLGSALQRRLVAIGLLVIDEEFNLKVRNRLYELVFTARWANENLPTRFKVPAIVIGGILLFAMIPFWYTQWLPGPYVRTLTSSDVELSVAVEAYEDFRSFPGHADTAENLYRNFLERRAAVSSDENEIRQLALMAEDLPNAGRLSDMFVAGFWDRASSRAAQQEDRDIALLAKIQSFVLATPLRRQRAAALISEDYPFLLTTLPGMPTGTTVFDPVGMMLTTAVGARISQYSYTPQGVQMRATWPMTALEVSPLVRRVIVDREGAVSRIGLTLNISHARISDLRIKIIAPSGRTVEIETGIDRASSNDDIRIPAQQFENLIGESLDGTWSISVRDEALGVSGQLVGWNLKLNSQGAVEYFQRGLNIPDPIERETENIWFDSSGRYAVARAMQSDSARIWDLSFAEPVRAIALPESDTLIGFDASARRLVSASQDRVNLWDTSTGNRSSSLAVGAASGRATLTPDRTHLFVERRGDTESRFELWNLEDGRRKAQVVVAGVPALVAIDGTGSRIAIADFDRAVRLWNFQSARLLGQFDLPAQPADIRLSVDGTTLGAVYPDVGMTIWNTELPHRPLLEELGRGNWQLAFSPSGNVFAAGRPQIGFQVYSSADGKLVGPPLGVRGADGARDMLAFSQDEQVFLTGSAAVDLRLWRVPGAGPGAAGAAQKATHVIWNPASDRPVAVAPDGSFVAIGDPDGHVHIVATGATLNDIAAISDDLSFVGHSGEIRLLAVAPSGKLLASVAKDNSVRFWNSRSGEPLATIVDVPGAPVTKLAFSPSGRLAALMSGRRISIIDVNDGETIVEHHAALDYSDMSFATEEQLYLGGRDGKLQLLARTGGGSWGLQQVWQGPKGIRLLRASPRGDFLILVDQDNLASQFLLSAGRVGEATLQLPSDVQEVAFGPAGTRAYFRTSRWIHLVSSSISGLNWMDAHFAPRPLRGAGIVHGNGVPDSVRRAAVYLPVAKNGYIDIVELEFGGSSSAGLFGKREERLQEWSNRINAARPEGS